MMFADLKPYDEYGEASLGRLPIGWTSPRLRGIARLLVSSVDKNVHDGERPVRLCNYVDVYKHDYITEHLDFMRGSATEAEARSFRLRRDDVLITKDSESFDDIGVPAYVPYEPDDLVCGYHLAILRPSGDQVSGSYLFRVLKAPQIEHQLQVRATGVTRFGLSHDDIKSIRVPRPPLTEQAAIVKYLAHADARISKAIAAKQRLIALLKEETEAAVNHAVTKGVDPDAPMSDSGISWLGDIPAHWRVTRAKSFLRPVDVRSDDGSQPLLSVSSARGVIPRLSADVSMFMAQSYAGHKLCWPGDLVINSLWAWSRGLGVSGLHGIVSTAYGVYRIFDPTAFSSEFLHSFVRSAPFQWELQVRSKGIWKSRLQLTDDEFLRAPVPVPPISEQCEISRQLAEIHDRVDRSIRSNQIEIELLREFRTRLTADVVTGQLDVRQVAASLLDIDPGEADDTVPAEPDTDDLADEAAEYLGDDDAVGRNEREPLDVTY
jgi:type I restriction enzyme S subunit